MKTRAQDRAPSAEPGAVPPSAARQSRKRRASSTATAIDDQHSVSQDASHQQQIKKRKKTTTVTTTTRDEESHPKLSTLDEEQIQVETTNGAETEKRRTSTFHTIISKISGSSRRSTLPPAETTHEIRASKSRSASRKSLPAAFAKDREAMDIDPFDPLTMQLIQQHREKRDRQSQSVIQLDGSDDLPEDPHDANELVQDGVDEHFTSPQQLRDHQSLRSLLNQGEDFAIESVNGAKTDLQRVTYEAHIDRLTREKAEAKAALEVLASGLESMGFGNPDSTPHEVLESILDAFGQSRYALNPRFPLETSEDVPESVMLANITDLLNNRDSSIDSLMDKLEAVQHHFSELQHDKATLQAAAKEDAEYITEIELKLSNIEHIQEKFSSFASEKTYQITSLEERNASLMESLGSVNATLEDSELTVKELRDAVERMEHEHAKAVLGLESDRDDAQAKLGSAEEDIVMKIEEIRALKETCQESTTIINTLNAEVRRLSDSLEEETTRREEAEADVARKFDTIRQQEEDLAELTSRNESERRQREAAETELDERQVEIKNLNDKLHKQGVEANQLRQKLYEQQLHSQKSLEQLEAIVQERDQLLKNEKEERADAESLAADRIAALEQQLTHEVEESKKKALGYGRELDELEQRNLELENSLTAATSALAEKMAELAEAREDSGNKIADLESAIGVLEDDLAQERSKLATTQEKAILQQQQMEATLAERDADIKQLSTDLDNSNQKIDDLEREKESLERRIENEAEAMLIFQGEKADEISSLREIIQAKDHEIHSLGEKAAEVDATWHELDEQKETIISERNEDILLLKKENAELRAEVLAYMARSRDDAAATFDRLQKLPSHSGGGTEASDVFADSPVVVATERKKIRKSRKSVRDSGVAIPSDGLTEHSIR
ncbi:hypothetical protein K461DRAFT_278096 [Myriangium duriaei CBS 260.36]|uniref:Uncharacterized protein n=1 Tax=Myriangium duriaei CBS 260.36 TaxID=1168546 RepID=A0A9P4MHK7_9PEZI|nr:hypothetical protein K461DRAFT_278096 [Myriangium duriaei CBS 260.36]